MQGTGMLKLRYSIAVRTGRRKGRGLSGVEPFCRGTKTRGFYPCDGDLACALTQGNKEGNRVMKARTGSGAHVGRSVVWPGVGEAGVRPTALSHEAPQGVTAKRCRKAERAQQCEAFVRKME
mmetsp:Transcript_3094/g.5924  ORF Transcript_3094/g.5924 Transcript_3094/m.5924 type:complete len:122 (-) Transcript_3094:72-437(-)